MQLTEAKKNEFIKRILLSRLRILNDYGFYGLLLMHMKFGIDEGCKTAYTDAHKICFSPNFLNKLSNSELDFVMMHEIMHVVLKHCFRGRKYDQNKFNIACDIVVNSNILYSNNMDISSITIKGEGPSMHLTPKGDEGYNYTAEEVYEMLPKNMNIKQSSFDDHSHWDEHLEGDDNYYEDEWEERLESVLEALQIKESSKQRDVTPVGAYRLLKELRDSTVDWRTLLLDFINFEISDYSFAPPDRRFDEYNFFLPDYNEKDETINFNILFEVDTSGSMSDDDIKDAYSEIKGAIEFAEGKLKGWLGFYDAKAYPPKPFESVEDILKIKPKGGGGTSCISVFNSLNEFENIMVKTPDAIIFITDGIDSFPSENVRRNIPVFWIITNDKYTPPWGIVARINHNKKDV